MNYPITRHYQRYEYLVEQGLIKDKRVLDIGCGLAAGSMLMRYSAKAVVASDPSLTEYIKDDKPVFISGYIDPSAPKGDLVLKDLSWEQLEQDGIKVDVVVAVELLEHLVNPARFLDFAADTGEYLFLTTPLATKTAPTDNPNHVVEFSHDDLLSLLNKRFNVLNTIYQTGDLQFTNKAEFRGSSMDRNHIVQMVWCKRKDEKK